MSRNTRANLRSKCISLVGKKGVSASGRGKNDKLKRKKEKKREVTCMPDWGVKKRVKEEIGKVNEI